MSKQIQKFEQKQSLTMTTGMHQSIAILQMSSMDLIDFAASELDKNPFIEDDNVTVEYDNKKTKDNNITDLSNYRSSNYNSSSGQDFLSNIASDVTLKDHIAEQINISINDHRHKLIAYYLLDSLQDSGYLSIELEEAARNLKCEYNLVEQVLCQLQNFDPPGIFARNLRECLMLQLKDLDVKDPSLMILVENIDLLASGNLKKLSKLCDVELGNLGNLIKQIKLLNPKPASGFLVEQTRYKIPDVILSIDESQNIKLEMNPDSLPRLKVNQDYYLKIKDTISNKEEREFTKVEIESANAIVKSIEQRASTILKVAGAIVQEQIDFFTRGIMFLKPMTLSKIATMTDFNESTVSRATANKYISTPTGIYELKYFFSSSLSSTKAASHDISSTKVKELIRQIILAEDESYILSDDDIAVELSKFNVNIARRTVAKYREALGIATSSVRKRNRMLVTT